MNECENKNVPRPYTRLKTGLALTSIENDRTRSSISYWLWWYRTQFCLCPSKKSRFVNFLREKCAVGCDSDFSELIQSVKIVCHVLW